MARLSFRMFCSILYKMEIKRHILKIAGGGKYIFEAIRAGKKKVETRAGTVKYQKIKTGDFLIFSCDGEKFEKKIKKVKHFSGIKEILKVYKPEEINPRTHSEKEAKEVYYSFPGYKEKIEQFGLFAFELE